MLCVCFIEKLYFLHKCRRQEKYKSNGQYLTTTCCWSPAMDKVKILPKIKFTAIMTHESVSGRYHFIMTLRGNCRWSIDQCINVYTWYIYTYIYICIYGYMYRYIIYMLSWEQCTPSVITAMALWQNMHLGTWAHLDTTVHHVPKCMSCHKAFVVITGRAHCFHSTI